MPAPGLHRVVLVETGRLGHRLPETIDIRLAEDAIGPTGGWAAGQGPADPVTRHLGQPDRHERALPRRTDAPPVEVREETRIRLTGQEQDCSSLLHDLEQAIDQPLRRQIQRFLWTMRDQGSLDVRVDIANVDESPARPI